MIVQKTQNESGAFVPNIPEGLEYKSATYRAKTDDYLIEFSPEQMEAQRITAAQGRIQLIRLAKKDAIDKFVAEKGNDELKVYWEYSTYWLRNSPIIIQLGEMFEIDLDSFWADAKNINI